MIREYIAEQPGTTAATFGTAAGFTKSLRVPHHDRIVLIGSGSSLNALTILKAVLDFRLGVPIDVVNPTIFLRDLADAPGSPLIVILSQSGASTTTVAAAAAVLDRGWRAIVVTADGSSPIARLGLPLLILPIGDEPIGPKTKGFTASVAACLALAASIGNQRLPVFTPDSLAATIPLAFAASRALVGEGGVPDYVAVSGSRRFFGVALEASLKISEISGVPSAAFEPEELLHGRLHGLGARSCGIAIAGDPGELATAMDVAEVMRERGVRIRILNMTDTPSAHDWMHAGGRLPAPLDTIAAIVPFQSLAVELAIRKGMEPELMTYPGLSKALSIKVQPAG